MFQIYCFTKIVKLCKLVFQPTFMQHVGKNVSCTKTENSNSFSSPIHYEFTSAATILFMNGVRNGIVVF
jgi:hypothetical protein